MVVITAALEREMEPRLATFPIGAIGERDRAAVGFRDLSAQGQANAGSPALRGEKRHEKVRRIGNARTFISYIHI